MYWFVAKIVYQIICGNGNHMPQFDEQLRLVSAENAEQAWKKACEIGVQEQYSFRNQRRELVEWRFVSTPEVYPLEQLSDGMELYSRIEEPEDASAYIAWLQTKAAQLAPKALVEN